MPIYAYRCEACGHQLDALQKISDAPLTDCPECGAAALKKQVTAAAFRLKGAGWYETDFKKDGKKNLHEDGAKTKEKATDTDRKPDQGTATPTPAKTETAAKTSDKTPAATAKPKPKPESTPKPAAADG